ncbi:alpha/beta hydrolase family protein [Novosphingobium taihuense]|uniref:Dienelactone hydrolase n=1 Tax=Novosphingobium taihuense TaxID=260085 RepID=A0A7W7A8V7_9SPHN|nr:prolyl oligopeptidase family serine peptidase [Novosphingobium taihuense]MBB4612553.1 dienelactone hydrolase [Novosphingobium taihuense]
MPFVEGARLSPDGLWIAGQFAVNGSQRIVVISPFDTGSLNQAALPDDVEVSSMQWVGNDNLLIRITAIRPFDVGDRAYISRVVALNRKTDKFTKLMWDLGGQNAADVLWVPKDGSTKILLGGQNSIYMGEDFWPAVYSVDVTNGRHTTEANPRSEVLDWVADTSGVVRAAISNDRTKGTRTLLYRAKKGRTFDRKDRRAYDDLEVPVLIRADENKMLVLRPGTDGRDALVEIDGDSGAVLQTLYQAEPGVDIEGVRYDDSGNEILGVYLGGNATDPLHWLDPALGELQKAFEKSLNGRRARIVSLSADRQRMLVRVDKPDEAGRLYYFDAADGSLRLFANLNSATNGTRAGRMEKVHYKARDGLEIEAIMTTPSGREAKNLPVVILPHGGPWAQDTMDWDYWAQFIASRGYLVIQPNFRGSTGYGEAFLKKGEGQLGLAMQDDVNDALAWAAKQGLADAKRACVVGASYGGYVAMWGAARDPDMWRCSISIAGVANLRREVNDFGDLLFGKRYREHWQKMTPDFPAVSPINHIDAIKVPMLLIHGKKDLTVDHAQSQSMFNKMKAAGKNVEFVSLPKADHYFTREPDRLALLSAIEAFLAKHNPVD